MSCATLLDTCFSPGRDLTTQLMQAVGNGQAVHQPTRRFPLKHWRWWLAVFVAVGFVAGLIAILVVKPWESGKQGAGDTLGEQAFTRFTLSVRALSQVGDGALQGWWCNHQRHLLGIGAMCQGTQVRLRLSAQKTRCTPHSKCMHCPCSWAGED